AAHDTQQSASESDKTADKDLCLDITEASAIRPRFGVVVWPQKYVDEGAKVEYQDPEDETAGCDVAIAKMPDERQDIEGDSGC
ncbi:hypothetical protein LTR16_010408, partial [Cryomyces antarcticus]